MDKYVIRIPSQKLECSTTKKKEPRMKQTTIESLSRVVNIERIVQLKEKLNNKSSMADEILCVLKELEIRTPSKEVLLETKIGHVVNRLRKHIDADVREHSRIILKRWKTFYRDTDRRKPLEVKSDLKTRQIRIKSKSYIAKALNVEDIYPLVQEVERTIYSTHKSCSYSYRKQVRTIYMKIHNNIELRTKIMQGTMRIEEIVNIGITNL